MDARGEKLASISSSNKSGIVASRWTCAAARAAKVGKGLSKHEKSQTLDHMYTLEVVDRHHRYGRNLHIYYDVWIDNESSQPFFYWLDMGDGKEINVEKCSRTDLQQQCIRYLGKKEREEYEVRIESGKLVYKGSEELVNTSEGKEWMFVLSPLKKLYVGEKKRGYFQHSSFLAGGATISSGRLICHNGILQAIWPCSGHYRPKEDNFVEFCSFLEQHFVDLTNVKKHPYNVEIPQKDANEELKPESVEAAKSKEVSSTRME